MDSGTTHNVASNILEHGSAFLVARHPFIEVFLLGDLDRILDISGTVVRPKFAYGRM